MELFCISRLLNVVLENDEEFVYMDCSCPVGELSLLHPWLVSCTGKIKHLKLCILIDQHCFSSCLRLALLLCMARRPFAKSSVNFGIFPTGNGSLQSMMELLHNFLAKPKWEESAVHRAKQMFLSHYKSLHKSLERETADRIMGAMFGPSR